MIALDGKALRRGYERGKSHMPPVMVTAWAAQTRMALANVLAPNNNEAAGALQLLELLQLKGCVVTADALHCHRGMAKEIVERGGDYVLAVKNNQPALLRDAKTAIAAAARQGHKPVTTTDVGHGRKERRAALVAPVKDMAKKHDFPGLRAVARITSKRGKDRTVERYFLMSQHYRRQEVCALSARTGPSKMACIGLSTLCSTRIWPAIARTTRRQTSPCSGVWLSTSPALIPTPKLPCVENSNAQDGTMLSSANFSATCDSPALAGEGGACRSPR